MKGHTSYNLDGQTTDGQIEINTENTYKESENEEIDIWIDLILGHSSDDKVTLQQVKTVTATPQTCRGTDGEKVTCRWTEIIILRKEVQRIVL